MNNKNLKPIPEIGKFYHFWDDGKTSTSRHYICKVERIITPKEAKNIIIQVPEYDWDNKKNIIVDKSLYDQYQEQARDCDWLYVIDTDFLVEISCPVYDEHNLWCVRTKDGGWFSIDVQSWWQSGRLDITGEIYNNIIKECLEEGWDISGYEDTKYEKN